MEESELPEQNSQIYFQSHAQSVSLKPPLLRGLGGAHAPGQDGRALVKTLLAHLLAGSSEPPVRGGGGRTMAYSIWLFYEPSEVHNLWGL